MSYQKAYPWILVALLWGVGLLNYLDRQMFATMQSAMAIDIHQLRSATKFGFLMGIFLWVYGFMSPIAGVIGDKVNRKWLITLSLLVWSGVTFGMGFATTYSQLYCLRAIMGISEALYLPTGLAMIADFHEKKTRSLAIGIHMTGLYLGSALGGFGGTLSAIYSWHITFHTFGIVGIIYAIILVLFLKEKNGREDILSKDRKRVSFLKVIPVLFSNIAFWIILFYFAVPSIPGWATKNWLPTLFASHLNMPMSRAGPLATITIAASSFAGVIIGGIISDSWVLKNVRGRVYTSAIGVGLTIPALIFLGFGHSLFDLISAGICFGFGFGLFDGNNMPILCQFVSAKYRATAYGIMNMIGVFSGAFITDLLGKATDANHLGRDFGFLAIIVLIALIIQLSFLKPRVNDFMDEKDNQMVSLVA